MKIAKAEARPGAGEAADSLPLLITAHTEPLSLAALHAAMTDAGAAWLSAEGLRADTAQRAESRFYAFYRTAGEIATAHGGWLLCPSPAPPPSTNGLWGLQSLLCSGELLLSQFTALLRISDTANVAPVLPYPQAPEEITAARVLLEQAMQTLCRRGLPFDEALPLGVLLGTPRAVLATRTLLEEVDFLVLDADAIAACGHTESELALLRLLEVGVGNAHLSGRFAAVRGQITLSPPLRAHLLAMGADALCLPTPALSLHFPV